MPGYTIYTSTGAAGAPFDFDPTPADGATVVAADPLTLSWLLPDPNNGTDDILVDVYWDTDAAGDNATTHVLANEPNALTVNVTADEIGTYYWKIVATDPNTDGDAPYVAEEAVFSLITVDGCQAAKDAATPYSETDARLIGDTNFDCKVDLIDFAALALNWLTDVSPGD